MMASRFEPKSVSALKQSDPALERVTGWLAAILLLSAIALLVLPPNRAVELVAIVISTTQALRRCTDASQLDRV